MSVCVCVCMYVCVCVCVYVRVHVSECMCVCVSLSKYVSLIESARYMLSMSFYSAQAQNRVSLYEHL